MGRKDKDPVPGSGTDEDYLRRTGMTRAEYLEYMRNANRRRNERETREFREGKRRFQDAEAQREEERGRSYLGFLRKYGTEEERAEGKRPGQPDPGRVRRWWQGRGQHDRWVGQDTPPSGEKATPPDRPRRTGTSVGDLIGIQDPKRHEPSNPVSAKEQRRRADERKRRSDPSNPENWGSSNQSREDLADESERNRKARQREADRRRRESDPTNPENWGKKKGGGGGGSQASSGGLGIFSAPSAPRPPDDDNGDDDDNGGGLGIFKGAW